MGRASEEAVKWGARQRFLSTACGRVFVAGAVRNAAVSAAPWDPVLCLARQAGLKAHASIEPGISTVASLSVTNVSPEGAQ